MEVIIAAIPLVLSGAILAAVFMVNARQTKAFMASFANDPDMTATLERGRTRCRTKRPPFIDVERAGGGKNNPRRWDASGAAPRVSARTTLHLSREGAIGGLREMLGVEDVHTGDEAFDKSFTLRGVEPDVVRGIFQSVDVKQAVHALFAVPAWSFDIRANGTVFARAPRNGLDAAQAKAVALGVARLVEVLEMHADDPPVVLRSSLPAGATGGSTGAPVGVPIGPS